MALDAIRSMGVTMLLNKYFADYGEIVGVEVEPKSNQAVLQVLLKGEKAPLWLQVDYQVEPDAFVVVNFRCEREWITSVLNRFLSGKRFDLSNSVAQAAVNMLF